MLNIVVKDKLVVDVFWKFEYEYVLFLWVDLSGCMVLWVFLMLMLFYEMWYIFEVVMMVVIGLVVVLSCVWCIFWGLWIYIDDVWCVYG